MQGVKCYQHFASALHFLFVPYNHIIPLFTVMSRKCEELCKFLYKRVKCKKNSYAAAA